MLEIAGRGIGPAFNQANGKNKCPCRMGTLARSGLKTETQTGKSAHPTSRSDNFCRSPNGL